MRYYLIEINKWYDMTIPIDKIKEIYLQFRKAQSFAKNRGYRMPKDFEKHFNEKMAEVNRKALIKVTGWFLTKWQNIDPYTYFLCGFELFSSFSYTTFFNEKIILLYIRKDKNNKRDINTTKKGLIKSAKFVKTWMNENNKTLSQYIHTREENLRVAIDHYLKNKIDASFFVFLIKKGMQLTDEDRSLIPYIQEKYRKIYFALNDIDDFLEKLEEKLNEHET